MLILLFQALQIYIDYTTQVLFTRTAIWCA